MLLASNIKLVLLAAAGFAGPLAMTADLPVEVDQPGGDRPALVELQPGSVQYRAAGDFTRAGKPAEAPLTTVRIAHPLAIMRHQVSGADYQRCVDGRRLPRVCLADAAIAADRPAVQVSWRDADAYAAWLSRRTGETYRLPTDEEWAYAAGSRYQDDGLPVERRSRAPLARPLRTRGEPQGSAQRQRSAPVRRLRGERARAARPRRQCLGMDQHVLRPHRARRGGRGGRRHGELRRARRRGPAPLLRDATSSATRARADARPASRRAISGSGWCASRNRGCGG